MSDTPSVPSEKKKTPAGAVGCFILLAAGIVIGVVLILVFSFAGKGDRESVGACESYSPPRQGWLVGGAIDLHDQVTGGPVVATAHGGISVGVLRQCTVKGNTYYQVDTGEAEGWVDEDFFSWTR